MLQPLVVGLGRSGTGLHLKVLSRLLEDGCVSGPPVACDPRPAAESAPPGAIVTRTLSAAAALVTPRSTVVHLCTPPVSRLSVLEELTEYGFRKILVEKPLATNRADLAGIERLRRDHGLELAVVAHWHSAELTRRLQGLVRSKSLGSLRSIKVAQHKPRFHRSLASRGHPTAFDVEIPHSLGVVLRLAGNGTLADAECSDMHCGGGVLPHMGSARLVLHHDTGVVTEIVSNLSSPVQERSIRLDFESGSVTGHYPLSENDDHAHLITSRAHHVFRDDALMAFMLRTYRDFGSAQAGSDFADHSRAVGLLCDAKDYCGALWQREGDHAA